MPPARCRGRESIEIEILKQGGNAVDAAAAVGFTLAVTSSSNGNLGGGGFMVTRMANGKTFTLDYREMAPKSAYKDLFLDSSKNVIKDKSTKTHYASGIPGSVDGLLRAWKDHGSGNISIQQLLNSDSDHRVIVIHNKEITRKEILLIINLVALVIKNGMKILGVSLPKKM